jgi:hypothetical protein
MKPTVLASLASGQETLRATRQHLPWIGAEEAWRW